MTNPNGKEAASEFASARGVQNMEQLARANKLPKRQKGPLTNSDKDPIDQVADNVRLLVSFAREKAAMLKDMKTLSQKDLNSYK